MAKYNVPLNDGTYTSNNVVTSGPFNDSFDHQLAFRIQGNPTGGTVTVSAKAEGSDTFEPIPDGVINLTSPQTVLFQFQAREYQFVVSGSGVTTGFVVISDVPFRSIISGGR